MSETTSTAASDPTHRQAAVDYSKGLPNTPKKAPVAPMEFVMDMIRGVWSERRFGDDTEILTPKKDPLGDKHHTDVPLTEEDVRIGDILAFTLGSLFVDVNRTENSRYWYYEKTSIDEWSRVARALRIHGLAIVNAHDDEDQQVVGRTS